ncbi:MAG: hypothetical protein HY830_16515 [Actinobacteria bacterium]|nr:hypothetical protein [Actinomycetota bacterium]
MAGTGWDEQGENVPPAGGPAWGAPAAGAPIPPSPYGSGPATATGSPYDGGYAPPGYAPGAETLAHGPTLLPAPRRRRGAVVAAGLAAALVVGGVGVGGYVATGLLGGGDQPEDHLPASAVAMVKLDLDPSAGQKIDAIRFARKFPGGKDLREDGDPREWMWEKLTRDVEGAPPWSQASEWIGDRAALAVLPPAAGATDPDVVGVLAVTDEKAAVADMASLENAGVAAADGWLVLARTDAAARAVVTAAKAASLAGAKTFSEDLDRIGEDGVAAAWFDGPGISALAATSSQALGGLPGCPGATAAAAPRVPGHGAVTLRFDGPSLELFGSVVGADATVATSGAGTGIEALPAGTLAGIGAAGLGPAVTKQWDQMLAQVSAATCQDAGDLVDVAATTVGLDLPGDLATLLGDTAAVSVGGPGADGTPSVGLEVTTSGAGLGDLVDTLSGLASDAGVPLTAKVVDGGYVAGTDTEALAALEAPGARLSAVPRFRDAAPDAVAASVVAFADVQGLLAAYGDTMPADARADLAPLDALGVTVVVDGDGEQTLRVRLTTR